jgi:hypothetical protein
MGIMAPQGGFLESAKKIADVELIPILKNHSIRNV